jgi:hypothetical protein
LLCRDEGDGVISLAEAGKTKIKRRKKKKRQENIFFI